MSSMWRSGSDALIFCCATPVKRRMGSVTTAVWPHCYISGDGIISLMVFGVAAPDVDFMFLSEQNAHPRDCRIMLVDEDHAYWLDGTTRFPRSVSGVWARFFDSFDAGAIVDKYFDKRASDVTSIIPTSLG